MFVEGGGSSLDKAIYRACYPEWTIISRGACEEVIHAVVTMRANRALTRVTCAGIVDADDYRSTEESHLESKGIGILPVSEIENLFMLHSVLTTVLAVEGYDGASLDERRERLLDELFALASNSNAQRASVLRYCRRRIDRTLKKIDVSDANDVPVLATTYASKTSAIDVHVLARTARSKIQEAIATRDVSLLLRWFDNKGVLAIVAKARGVSKANFEQWLLRVMRNGSAPTLTAEIRLYLPNVTPR